jgi:hypothetical protein
MHPPSSLFSGSLCLKSTLRSLESACCSVRELSDAQSICSVTVTKSGELQDSSTGRLYASFARYVPFPPPPFFVASLSPFLLLRSFLLLPFRWGLETIGRDRCTKQVRVDGSNVTLDQLARNPRLLRPAPTTCGSSSASAPSSNSRLRVREKSSAPVRRGPPSSSQVPGGRVAVGTPKSSNRMLFAVSPSCYCGLLA